MRAPALILLAAAGPALALDLPAPARLTAEDGSEGGTLALATGPWADDGLPVREVEGRIRHEAWVIPGTSLTPLQMLDPLRAQLEAEDFTVLFSCADEACGGFDFRYALDLLPEPEMHVDLGDYRYLSAARPDGAAVALVTSRGNGSGYIHVSRAGPETPVVKAETPEDEAGPAPEQPAPATEMRVGLEETMARDGHAVLGDLEFATGSSELAGASFPSLIELAAWLNADPARQVVLVGHSDAVGSLDANIDLSRRRAEAVAARLRDAHGVAPGQISAEGVGFLAPVAPNATEAGRAANRRVDAVVVAPGE